MNIIHVGSTVRLKNGFETAKVFCYLHDEVPANNIVMLDHPLMGTEFWSTDDLENV